MKLRLDGDSVRVLGQQLQALDLKLLNTVAFEFLHLLVQAQCIHCDAVAYEVPLQLRDIKGQYVAMAQNTNRTPSDHPNPH